MVPASLKLKAKEFKVAKSKSQLGRGSYSKSPRLKMTRPKNSIIDEVANSTVDKRSGVTQRASLYSVNTDLILDGTMSEAEMQCSCYKDQFATNLNFSSIKSTADDRELIKHIYKLDNDYNNKRSSLANSPWQPVSTHFRNCSTHRQYPNNNRNLHEMQTTRITLRQINQKQSENLSHEQKLILQGHQRK